MVCQFNFLVWAFAHSDEVDSINRSTGALIVQCTSHYKTSPMLYTEILLVVKIEKNSIENLYIFAQNIDCGYTLELPHLGDSNEYPQSMFWSKNKKNKYTPA